jgi:hypothetical protein
VTNIIDTLVDEIPKQFSDNFLSNIDTASIIPLILRLQSHSRKL